MSDMYNDLLSEPPDLKSLTEEELLRLASRCREIIIRTVSANGGHLASNLGVVELTIALMREFDFASGHDQLVWDVGHQCYTWKLLSGRAEQFSSLRCKDGLSGFPKHSESSYDCFNTGHSSTSISAALGISRAKRLKGDDGLSIAVTGDGAMTGGMIYEALNDAVQRKDRLLVILNDNQMSIDENVGGLSQHLERLRISPHYFRLKKKWGERLASLPLIGTSLKEFLSQIKSLDRVWYRRRGCFFEQLGMKYYGPVDGHDLNSLCEHLEAMRHIDGPVLLHVLTRKGMGYKPAEESPERYHGVAPFVIESGVRSQSKLSYSLAVGQKLVEMAKENERIVAITAAMMSGTGLNDFAALYPERFFDTGIAEQHAVTLAAGMASAGLRPFVAIYSTFLQRALDQVIHDVCLQDLPVTFMMDRAGLVPDDGETHQGLYDFAYLSALPNIELFAPADRIDLDLCMEYAEQSIHPLAIRYPKSEAVVIEELGSREQRLIHEPRLVQSGSDATVIVIGTLINEVIDAAVKLKQNTIKTDIFSCISNNFTSINGIIKSLHNSKRLIVVEEAVERGGYASMLIPRLMESVPGFTFKHFAVNEPLAGQASRKERLKDEGLDAEGISSGIIEFLNKEHEE